MSRDKPASWLSASHHFFTALRFTVAALELADATLSRWIQAYGGTEYDDKMQELAQDADVIGIAVQYLVRGRRRFIAMAEKLMATVERKLAPQWKSRDEAKSRMGSDRWRNNPHPKNDYAERRAHLEAARVDISKALEFLHETMSDTMTADLQATCKEHQKRVREQTNVGTIVPKEEEQEMLEERYNGERHADISDSRVSLEEYPDPADFGWIFTGSSHTETIEYFERRSDITGLVEVWLDFNYVTATLTTRFASGSIRTGRNLMPNIYQKILENPQTRDQQQQHQHQRRPRRRRPTRPKQEEYVPDIVAS